MSFNTDSIIIVENDNTYTYLRIKYHYNNMVIFHNI